MTAHSSNMQGAYELLDSGDQRKLERFGDKILIRPSSLCIWRPHLSSERWNKADATHEHKRGWIFKRERFSEWQIPVGNLKLNLKLQDNGQIGFFPEHSLYINELIDALNSQKQSQQSAPAVLNLFAYTGLASVVSLQQGAAVTHVDLSKRVLQWASSNFELNNVRSKQIRLIEEDALKFVEREVRRDNHYDIIIADPPNFSRLTSKNSWNLDEILPAFIENLAKLLAPGGGSIFFTSHNYELGLEPVSNLLRDALLKKNRQANITSSLLKISESGTQRVLPAGCFVHCNIRD